MALATGMFNASFNPAELNVKSFAGTILRKFPNGSAPMFALSSQMGKSKAKASTHGYFSKTMQFVNQTVAAGIDDAATAVEIASTAGIVPSALLRNNTTGEIVRVTAVTNGTTLAITRAFGRIAAAAMTTSHKLVQVGTAAEEGSNRPTARRLSTVYVPNYTQIWRNAWAITDTARASYAEAGFSNIAENRNECAMFHSVDIESSIIWGQPMMDTSGSAPIHTTQGILDAIEQYAPGNSNAAGSTTTFAQFVALIEPAFEYSTNIGNPKERMGYCDKVAMRVINEIGQKYGQLQVTMKETSFGMIFSRVDTYKGSINLIEHPLLNGLEQSGSMIIVDHPALKLAYMEGRDTKPEEYGTGKNNADNGQDAQGGSLTTEAAVELINPYACAYITGLTAGVSG